MAVSTLVLDDVSLLEINAMEEARVHLVEAPAEETNRLRGMGVCRGRLLKVLKAGDPLIVRVYGCRIAMSARLARLIRVIRPSGADDPS